MISVALLLAMMSGAQSSGIQGVGGTGPAEIQPRPLATVVTDDVVIGHLLKHPDPVYPPIAKAAHVSGVVRLMVAVDTDGTISSVTLVSGPPMLQGAAMDAVKVWTFTPFELDGKVARVSGNVTVPFELPSNGQSTAQLKAAQAYFPLEAACRTALGGADHEAAVSACKLALDTVKETGDVTKSDQLGTLDAHEAYAHALLNAGRAPEALAEGKAAVGEATKCLTATDEEYGTALYWRAVPEVVTGQTDAALADMAAAEETERKAISHLPSMKTIYGRHLASMLRQHAGWLEQLGRGDEAVKLRAEADAL